MMLKLTAIISASACAAGPALLPASVPAVAGLLLAATAPAALAAGTTERVSVSSGGAQANATTGSGSRSISADGRYVVFDADATNLVPDDTNGAGDVFVRDRLKGTTERVSVSSGGKQGNNVSFGGTISADGRFVGFTSDATNLVPGGTNDHGNAFVHDRKTGKTRLVSVGPGGVGGNGVTNDVTISPNGRFVGFDSFASDLVPGDTNGTLDAFVYDLRTGTTERVTVGSDGRECETGGSGALLSATGRFVAFTSSCTDLVPGGTNGLPQAYVRDRTTGKLQLVSVSSAGVQSDGTFNGASAISLSGRFVALISRATNLVPGDTNGQLDVFVRDRWLGTTERVSVSSRGEQGNGFSSGGDMSADGRFVTFSSQATNLVPGDTNGVFDVFVRDRATGWTRRVSVGADGHQGNGDSVVSALSWSGRIVVFNSVASNLVPDDTNGVEDVFAHAR
jgi:Tol biopolymer transport system component